MMFEKLLPRDHYKRGPVFIEPKLFSGQCNFNQAQRLISRNQDIDS